MNSVVLFFLFLLPAVAAAAVRLFVCMFLFFPFAKLVLFRFLSWFSISLTCSNYINVTFFCTLVLSSTNIFYYIPVKLSVISWSFQFLWWSTRKPFLL